MPGRPRRVRLLAIVLCIATVFFLYERNAARDYADYLEGTVGGGSVLRKGEQNPIPAPEPQSLTEEVRPSATTATSTSSVKEHNETPEPTPTPTLNLELLSSSQRHDSTTSAESSSAEQASEDQLTTTSKSTSTTLKVTQHWTKLPEKFPITSTIELPSGTPKPIPLIQKQGKGTSDEARLAKIKEACNHAWSGFRAHGWGFDELRPIKGGGQNSFNGWGATLVDSLDTLWIMGMKDEFEDAVNKTADVDFTYSSRNDIPLFEVTIRYLGGLLGAYDVSGRKYKVLLDKAVELAEVLYSAFDTPNRMPETYYHWKPAYASNKHRAGTRVVMAEIGTLSLEFTRLAQLTLEPKYYDAVARITDEFEAWQNNTRLPGMWPTDLDASGCAKPVHKRPTTTKEQSQEPGAPAEIQSPKQDHDQPASRGGSKSPQSGDKLPNANPAMGRGPVAIQGGASLRHPMEDHPVNGNPLTKDANSEGSTNDALAKQPLSPGGDPGPLLADPSLGKRPGEPLLPNAGGPRVAPIEKRQTDDSKAESLSTVATPKQTIQLEDDCEHQGFASVNKKSAETFTLGGKSDSTYEYLPKEYLLLGGRLDQYRTMYLESMEPVIERLLFRPMMPENYDILISGELAISLNFTSDDFIYTHHPKAEHLTCFVGGMFGMGGKIFEIPEHIEIAKKLTEGCIWSYNSTKSGIMPDSFLAMPCEDIDSCAWNETAWHEELDPSAEFREDRRKDWQETYEVDDIESFQKMRVEEIKKKAAEAAASASFVAALAAKTAEARTSDLDDEVRKTGTNQKRQLPDSEPPPPRPASPPLPTILSTTADSDDDIWGGHEPYGGPDAEPTTTTPPKPVYTPDPPPTHEQYVKEKLEDERLPPGFLQIGGRGYLLRPEAIESVFYMYRITGDEYWREAGWKMFLATEEHARTKFGHGSLDDVTKSRPRAQDKMESFWIAETLKYYYLLFDDPANWSLDDWVLNTEAHFFRRPENPVAG